MASSSLRTWRYRVFASFHGPDVRKTFLSHLRNQFNEKGITMFNDQKIERGETIGPALTQAISESRISIVVLSNNYASSSWCLDELLEILKCKEDIGQIVLTVFCGVDPSDVRIQTGDFGIAFNKTCDRKKEEEKRQKWSKALDDVGKIAGEHFLNWDNESKMIEKIARDVSNKLDATVSWDFEDMAGIEAHLKKMHSLLDLDKEDGAMIVGICGPAGIGKTTIARALHSQLSSRFQLTCFMENLRGSSNSGFDEYGSKLCLQKQLLSKILKQKVMKINHLRAIQERLHDQKVLIILDDVDDLKQLEALANETKWFGFGSRIIVITEDQELLKKHDINNTYHVGFPTEEEARKIFCRYAFKQSSRPDGFEKFIERVTKLCSKLPLGLRVMGSYLCKKTEDDWEDILGRLEISLDPVDPDIERVLIVGYDSLHEKNQLLFLFIAFFFNYKDDAHVKEMLAENNLNVRLGLETLEYKSLIQISTEGIIVMHKLLQQVGREAVQRQDHGKRQILIDSDEIRDVLENEYDYRSVIGISFDISTIPNGVHINARAFKNIRNLRFLSIYKTKLDTNVRVHVPEDMFFPHRLRLLHWEVYLGKCLPPTFRPEYLVELNLRQNNLEKLWDGIQALPNLKKMDLHRSRYLKQCPNLSKATKLEMLDLSYCESLVELPPSIATLHKLERLEMEFCEKLQVVPSHLNLASLNDVYMSGCWQLRYIPNISKNITELAISDTMLAEMPDSFHLSARLEILRLYGSINTNTGEKFTGKRSGADIEKIPDWIKYLYGFKQFYIYGCPKLASLPELPASLRILRVDTCESLETLFPFDSPIVGLYFVNCFKLGREARRIITEQPFEACLPGSQMPAEFSHIAIGNSLTIRSDCKEFSYCAVVSRNQQDGEFCAVVSSNQQMDDHCLLILCEISINGCPIRKVKYHDVSTIRKEHLFMCYAITLEKEDGWLEKDNKISFEFNTSSNDVDITKCGVEIFTNKFDVSISSYEFRSEQFYEDGDKIFNGSVGGLDNESSV